MFNPFKTRTGFTLIELLIVVAIIAILAAIAVPNFLEAQTRAKISRVMADVRTVATAMETYRIDTNLYPPMSDYPNIDLTGPWPSYHDTFFHSRVSGWLSTPIAYLSSVPDDVFNKKDLRERKRYVYFNYHGMKKMTPASTSIAAQNEQTGGYLFYGNGPDGVTNQTGTASEKPGINGTWTRYDPTNGTVSLGNIVRTAKSPEGSIPYNPNNPSTTNGQN